MEQIMIDAAGPAVALLAGALVVLVGILTPLLRRWVKAKGLLTDAQIDEILGRRLDQGAISIIRGAEKAIATKLEAARGPQAPPDLIEGQLNVPPRVLMLGGPSDAAIIATAKPILEREFKTTLAHFEKGPAAVHDYLLARLDRAKVPG